jgi:hypothetical protein
VKWNNDYDPRTPVIRLVKHRVDGRSVLFVGDAASKLGSGRPGSWSQFDEGFRLSSLKVETTRLFKGEQLRQTTFLGWRDDMGPEEVVLE